KAEREKEKAAAAEKAAADKAAAAEKAAAEKAEREKAAGEKGTKVAAVTPGKAKPGECLEGMRLVAAGSFRMGTARDDPMMGFDERALQPTEVAGFCVDTYEWPNRRGVPPVVNVSWKDA